MQKTYSETLENLRSQPDLTLVQDIQSGSPLSSEMLEILSDRHSGLYVSTIMRLTGTSIPNLKEELLDDKMYVLYHAVMTYDKDRGSAFTTHFANEAKWNCLKNKTKKCNKEISCEESVLDLALDRSGQYDFIDVNDDKFFHEELMKEIEAIRDETAKKIIKLRYFSSDTEILPWKKIAEAVQLSIQGCINIHNKYVDKIKKHIDKKYKGKT